MGFWLFKLGLFWALIPRIFPRISQISGILGLISDFLAASTAQATTTGQERRSLAGFTIPTDTARSRAPF